MIVWNSWVFPTLNCMEQPCYRLLKIVFNLLRRWLGFCFMDLYFLWTRQLDNTEVTVFSISFLDRLAMMLTGSKKVFTEFFDESYLCRSFSPKCGFIVILLCILSWALGNTAYIFQLVKLELTRAEVSAPLICAAE